MNYFVWVSDLNPKSLNPSIHPSIFLTSYCIIFRVAGQSIPGDIEQKAVSILDNRKQCMDLNLFLGLGGFRILVFWGDGAGVANGQVNVTFRGRVYNWSAFFLKT